MIRYSQVAEKEEKEKATRQCWECLKRRLVCDCTLPHCKKCVKNGKECPGYGDQKPLQWVANGKVTSRRRRKESPSTALLNANIKAQQTGSSDSASGDEMDEWATRLAEEFDNVAKKYRADNGLEETFTRTCRRSIELVLTKKLGSEAKKLCNKKDDPLGKLAKTLEFMTLNEVPAYELRNETCEVVQSVGYFNMRIYPQLTEDELAPNPHIMLFPVAALHLLPPAVHHNLVVLTLCHFVYSLPPEQGKALAAQHAPKILHHRGATIREISNRLQGKMKTNDSTIVSIMMLMCCELQQTDPTGWRQHAIGLLRIFSLRGGMMDLYRTALHLRAMIVIFTYVVAFSNCCTPAHDQIMINASVDEHIANIETMYEELFPYCLVPPALFANKIRINHLRRQAAKVLQEGGDTSTIARRACELLANIDAFSPQDWAQPGAKYDQWLTIGHVYKSSLAVYCIMACQSLGLLPKSASMNAELRAHADSLLFHLKAALGNNKLKRFLAWPLVVAGVEAAYRGEGVRTWLERQMLDVAVFIGANCPLRMRGLLRRYWNAGQYGWEECFSKPEAFMF
ncbi:hypothetical protein CC80DRAFT_477989 [Byssothecium circinans]|uniref:Zn(2)-C6 fungal-type domain-containing protein n=1 Tax=Byssothecium circinans TaxID=147558 RepID=A0A6A5TNX0_9PLEO|nr:hypothetical protein CC80DRAFT_477989 [Byssothecium circinans]